MIQAVQTAIARAGAPLVVLSLLLVSAGSGSAHAHHSAAPSTCIDDQGREIYLPTGETIDQTVEVVGRRLPEPVPMSPAIVQVSPARSAVLLLLFPLLLLGALLFARGRLSQRRAARSM
jgi:hypothetical protein